MGKFGGTILTGRENFVLWNGNLKIELAAAKLKKYLRPEKCEAPIKGKDTTDDFYEVELEEWEYQHAQALKMILQSVDDTNRTVIQNCYSASSAYEILTQRYGMRDTALLAQLMAQLFAIQSMKQRPITENYNLIVNLTTRIADQEPEAIIPDIVQAVILMRSLSSEYDTTLEILTNKEKFPKLYEVFQTAKTFETKLAEPENDVITIDVANAAIKEPRKGKICWVYQGSHVKPNCPKWLATKKGLGFKRSGLRWHQWQEQMKFPNENAKAAKENLKISSNRSVHSPDSDSQSEKPVTGLRPDSF